MIVNEQCPSGCLVKYSHKHAIVTPDEHDALVRRATSVVTSQEPRESNEAVWVHRLAKASHNGATDAGQEIYDCGYVPMLEHLAQILEREHIRTEPERRALAKLMDSMPMIVLDPKRKEKADD